MSGISLSRTSVTFRITLLVALGLVMSLAQLGISSFAERQATRHATYSDLLVTANNALTRAVGDESRFFHSHSVDDENHVLAATETARASVAKLPPDMFPATEIEALLQLLDNYRNVFRSQGQAVREVDILESGQRKRSEAMDHKTDEALEAIKTYIGAEQVQARAIPEQVRAAADVLRTINILNTRYMKLVQNELFRKNDVAAYKEQSENLFAALSGQTKNLRAIARFLKKKQLDVVYVAAETIIEQADQVQQFSTGLLALWDKRQRQQEDMLRIREQTTGKLKQFVDAAMQDYEQTLHRLNTWQWGALVVMGVLFVVASVLIARSVTAPLARLVDYALKVAKGKLDAQPAGRFGGELAALRDALAHMVDNLRAKMDEARAKSEEAENEARKARDASTEAMEAKARAERARTDGMHEAAGQLDALVSSLSEVSAELLKRIEQVANGADQQNDRLTSTATAMEQMNATITEVARNAAQGANNAQSAKNNASEGARVVQDVVDAINTIQASTVVMTGNLNALGKQAEGIGAVLNVISDIADQTNLLALNAAIEAARAGDAGRGFAVVADEVRKLAEKTMHATREVGDAIGAIQNVARTSIRDMETAAQAVEKSTGLARAAGQSLTSIVDIVEETATEVSSIATASVQQSASSDEITRAIEDVSAVAAATAKGMTRSREALDRLTELSRQFGGVIVQLRQT